MATFIATAEYNSSSSNSGVCPVPTGTVDGDITFYVVCHYSEFANATPSGLTQVSGAQQTTGGGHRMELFYRVANSEPASYTFPFTTANRLRVIAVTYRGGFSLSNPIDAVSNTAYASNNTIVRAASFNVTAPNSHIIYFGIVARALTGSITAPTQLGGFTQDYESWNTTPDFDNHIASTVWTGSGATGDIDGTYSANQSTSKHAFAVSLTPGVSTQAITKSLAYSIKLVSVLNKSIQYAVVVPITTLTKSLKYTVVKSATAITKQLIYKVIKPTTVTKSAKYTVIKQYSLTKGLTYKILLNPAAIPKTLGYKVKTSPSITKSAQYVIQLPASSFTISKNVTYKIKAPVQLTKSLRYVVAFATTQSITKTLAYRIKKPNTITKQLRYNLNVKVYPYHNTIASPYAKRGTIYTPYRR